MRNPLAIDTKATAGKGTVNPKNRDRTPQFLKSVNPTYFEPEINISN